MMAAGNPNWWSMQHGNPLQYSASGQPSSLFSLLHHQLNLHGGSSNSSPSSSSSSTSSSSCSSSTSSLPFSPLIDDQSVPQDFPQSWSQLLLSGLASGTEEERAGLSSHLQPIRKLETWEGNRVINPSSSTPSMDHLNGTFLNGHHHHHHQYLMKQEVHGHGHGHDINHHQKALHQLHAMRPSTWSQLALPASSPKSCVTTLSSNNNNLLDFSSNSCKEKERGKSLVEQSSECNSPTTTGGLSKKPKVQSSIPPLKVRKEKLGDRITALHQIVSPFGKTDTASVLLEAIGYIRFLQSQIEALSSPYLGNASSKTQHSNYLIKDGTLKNLRSRGLCLVPISCTQLVGSDNNTAADYWAPSIGGGF